MFIQTEATPNPETLKFLPGKTVMESGVLEFRTTEEAVISPLAQRLFAVDGVTGVFLGADFISVSKDGTAWEHLKPAVLGAIMEHYLSGDPVVDDPSAAPVESEGEEFAEQDAATVAMIKEILDERVRPAVAGDDGDQAAVEAYPLEPDRHADALTSFITIQTFTPFQQPGLFIFRNTGAVI